MELRLFGEVQLRAEGQTLDVGTPRQQAVLAALAVDAGHPVPIEALIDRVWNDAPPEARNVLYSHLSRIRQLLRNASEKTGAAAAIHRGSAGYTLEIDPDLVDLHRFKRLVERANNGSDERRAATLSAALELWHGPPLAGIPGEWADRVRDGWRRQRLDAAVRWGELELQLGHTVPVLAALAELVTEYPLAEPLEALLIRALHASGRAAEALERFGAVRRRLADELGTDPGPELRALHTALLRGELPVPARSEPDSPLATPAQLPPDVFGFAGRQRELRLLDGVLTGAGGTARIIAVSGTAGVGKTSLAVHWAHRVRAEFPGGQLYANLRGFDPTGAPVSPTEAIRVFLDAFEVPQRRIPASFEAQVGLYRSLLVNRKVLVVLDNARDAEQVRPLLPGSPGCLVLVTSRSLLSGLVAAGALPLPVDLLDSPTALSLLSTRLGATRVAAEPVAAQEIVDLCARLPLALAVVAARAATHPAFGLAALAAELRGGLDELAGTDPATDPRAVFSWSYTQLTPAAARLFRLLGLHPGPDVGFRAAASLAGLGVLAARPLLAELVHAHLLAEPTPGRYACHDLLRAYAAEQARTLDPEPDRRSAKLRMLAHYIHTANHADHLLDPRREAPPDLTELPPGVTPEPIPDHANALTWFDTERPVLLTAIHQDTTFDAQVWELAFLMRRFLAHQGHWHNQIDSLTAALGAARRLGDPTKQGFAQLYLGCTYVWFGRHDDARVRFDQALDLYRMAADQVGQAYVEHFYSWMLERQARNDDALRHAERAVALFRAAGHRRGQARVLNAIGWYHAQLGEYQAAIEYCREALALQAASGDQLSSGETWHSLGYAQEHLGHYQQAVACYQTAAGRFRQSGYLINEAYALSSLGDALAGAGKRDAAEAAWRDAFEILDQLNHPDADKALAKLRNTEQ